MPEISVVLPCYRAAPLAARSVAELVAHLERRASDWEIVVVDDGGGDFGPGMLPDDPRVRLLTLPENRGKGAAVAAGMLAARGHVRVFTDVDVPYGVDLIDVMVAYVRDHGFHLVIGDRRLPESRYQHDIGWRRGVLSSLASAFIGILVTGGFFDTQCGLKAVRGDVADILFRLLRTERFAFDVELIYIALRYGADIKRIPVRLRENNTSSVRLLRDTLRAAADILRIKRNQLRGDYDTEDLSRIVAHDFSAQRLAATLGARDTAAR